MATLSQEELVALEKMVDKTNLQFVLEALATIAGEKADHIRENWQDESLAKAWDRATIRLSKFAESDAIHSLL